MKTADLKFCVVTLIALQAAAADGWAQEWLNPQHWLSLGPRQGESITEFDGYTRRTGEDQKVTDYELESRYRLRQGGFIINPRLAAFSVEIEPAFTTGQFKSETRSEDRENTFLRYSGDLSVLRGSGLPVSFNASATRASGTSEASLGSQSDFVTDNRYAALNVNLRYFTSTIDYSERLIDQSFRSGFTSVTRERDEALRTIRFRGRSSKMSLEIERRWFDDRIEVADRDFTTHSVTLSNSLGWGRGSNFNSRADYLNRSGLRAFERLNIKERVRLQHTENIKSSLGYQFSSVTQTTSTTQHSGDLRLSHRLYTNLTTSLNFDGSFSDSATSNNMQYGAGLNIGYQKKIPWEGRLSTGIGASRRINDRESKAGFVEVLDESQSVDLARTVVLNRRFINSASIVITDDAGIVVFDLGMDYTVASVAGNLTEIRILPGGQINIGDEILVSYDFEQLPSVKFFTDNINYRVALDFGWARFFHQASRTNQELISGVDERSLTDRTQSTTGANFRWDRPATRATFRIEQRSTTSGDFDTDSLRFGQTLSHRFTTFMSMDFSASEVFIVSNDSRSDFYSADLNFTWQPLYNLSLRPHLGVQFRNQEGGIGERFVTGSVDLQWAWRRLVADLRFTHNEWLRGDDETIDDRLFLTITRSF
jgi:hypothetical protein